MIDGVFLNTYNCNDLIFIFVSFCMYLFICLLIAFVMEKSNEVIKWKKFVNLLH